MAEEPKFQALRHYTDTSLQYEWFYPQRNQAKRLAKLPAYPSLMKEGKSHFTLDKEGSITVFLTIILMVNFV